MGFKRSVGGRSLRVRFTVALALFCMLLMLTGCAALGIQGIKPWSERTPEERLDTILSQYNLHYKATVMAVLDPKLTLAQKQTAFEQIRDPKLTQVQRDQLLAQVVNPNLTKEQKQVHAAKKEIFQRLKPLVDVYRLTVNSGGIPSTKTEDGILYLMDQLAAMAIDAVSK